MTYTLDESICNLNFYEGTNGLKQNSITVQNLSGRSVTWMANDKFLETKELKLRLENTSDNNEYTRFKEWFKSIGGCAGTFRCSALGSNLWRFVSVPSEDNGQKYKELSISIEQVYA